MERKERTKSLHLLIKLNAYPLSWHRQYLPPGPNAQSEIRMFKCTRTSAGENIKRGKGVAVSFTFLLT